MTEQQGKLLKAKIALSLATKLKRRPTDSELQRFTFAGEVLFDAIVGAYNAKMYTDRSKQERLF